MGYLELESADGMKIVFEMQGPGGSASVAVGEPGHRSGVWRIRCSSTSPDAYLEGELKEPHYSFHASGDWHQAFKSVALAEKVTGERIRIFDEWKRQPADQFGWTFAFTIWVPSEDVIDVPNDAQDGTNVIWLPQPAPGAVTAIRIVFAQPNRGQVELPEGVRPVGAFTLVDETVVLVMANAFEPDGAARAQLEAFRSACKALSAEKGGDTASGAVRWTVRAEESESGRRCIYDFAARPCARAGFPAAPT